MQGTTPLSCRAERVSSMTRLMHSSNACTRSSAYRQHSARASQERGLHRVAGERDGRGAGHVGHEMETTASARHQQLPEGSRVSERGALGRKGGRGGVQHLRSAKGWSLSTCRVWATPLSSKAKVTWRSASSSRE